MDEQQQVTGTPEVEVTDGPVQPESEDTPYNKPREKNRAGFTKNKGRGQSKSRRQMTKRSRRINRSK